MDGLATTLLTTKMVTLFVYLLELVKVIIEIDKQNIQWKGMAWLLYMLIDPLQQRSYKTGTITFLHSINIFWCRNMLSSVVLEHTHQRQNYEWQQE